MVSKLRLMIFRSRALVALALLVSLLIGIALGIGFQRSIGVGRIRSLLGISSQQLSVADRPTRPLTEHLRQDSMIALVFGQSNAANSGQSPGQASDQVYAFFEGHLYPAQDPLPGADGSGGSVWTRLGDRIIAAGLYPSVIFVPIAAGGSEISRWTPAGDLYPRLTQTFSALQQADLTLTHLLWHQGESDAQITPPEIYQHRFLQMLEGIRAQGVEAPIYVSQATFCRGRQDPNLRRAQGDLVDPTLGIRPGPNTDRIGLCDRLDGCHFSDSGLEQAADLWLKVLKTGSEFLNS